MHKLSLIAALSATLLATSALAANDTVTKAIDSRGELSQFQIALEKTGVINELQSGKRYTIFAPNDAAFAKLTDKDYPCLYSPQCTEEVAKILRNHIVADQEVLVSDASRGAAVYSINKHHIHVAEGRKGDYTVDGNNVISQNQLPGNVLYVIDGVIADKEQLAALKTVKAIPVALTPSTTTKQTSSREFRYRPDGSPGAAIESTTTTRTTTLEPTAGGTVVVPAGSAVIVPAGK